MDSEKLGTEALIFAVSFFVSLLIIGAMQTSCSSQFCLFVGLLPFVLGACFACEYDIIYSVKKGEVRINQREIFLVLLGFLGTIQIMGLIGYLILRGVIMPIYFWIIVCVIIYAVIVFLNSRIFEKD